MATIAILKSLHTMDNRQFIKGLSESQRRSRKAGAAIGRQARQMGRRFQTLTGNVFSLQAAIGVLAGSAGISLLVRQQMKQIQSTQRVAEVSGFASSTIEALMLQSDKYGISQERVNDALIDFSERIGEARTGTGEAVDAIERLEKLSGRQIDITQEASKVWQEYVAALNQVDDASDRASIAAQIGGDALRDIIPVINEGEQAFQEAAAQTDAMGLAFDAIDAAKVEAANDAIAEMKGSFTGMARIVTIELAEPIQAVADAMNEALTGSDDAQESIRSMTRASVGGVATLLEAAASVTDFVQQNATMVQFGLVGYVLLGKKGALIGSVIGTLIDGIQRRMAAFGIGVSENVGEMIRLEDRVEGLQNRLEMLPEGGREFLQVERQLREARGELERVQEAAKPEELLEYAAAWDKNEKAAGGLSSGLRSLAEAMRASLEEGEKLSELDMGASLGVREAGAFGGIGDGAGAADIEQKEMAKQQKRLDAIRQGMATEMELEQAHFEREQEFLQSAHETLFESEAERKLMLENLEREHQNRLFQIQTKGMGSLFSQQMQFLDQLEAAQKSSGAVQVGIMTNAFAQITAAGAQHSRKLFEINKAAGIANALVSTYVAAAKTWEQWGYPWGIPMVAAQIAAGMAQVQAIRSQSFSGGGGAAPSTSAGGGVPAVQDVSGQGQAERPQQNVTIDIAGGDDRLLSKRQLRRLMEEMQEELGDDASIGTVRIA